MMDVNFIGTYYAARAALPMFRAPGPRPPDLHLLDRRTARHSADERLQRDQGGAGRASPSRCVRSWRHRHPRQRGVSGLDRDRVPIRDAARLRLLGLGARTQAAGRATVAAAVVRCIRASARRGLPARARRARWRCSTPSRRPSPTGSCGATAGGGMRRRPERHRSTESRRTRAVDVPTRISRRRARSRPPSRGGRPGARRRRLGPRSTARPPPRTSTSRSTGCEPAALRDAAVALRHRSTPSARASPSTRSPTSTSRCRGANRRSAAGTRRSRSSAIPFMPPAEAARRRDFTVNAIAWDPLTGEYIDPFDGRADLDRPAAAHGRSAHFRRRQPARAPRPAARRALRPEMDDATRAGVPRLPLDDLPAERVWGEIEKLLLLRAASVHRLAAGPRARGGRAAVPGVARRWSSARRSRNGIPKGTCGSTR